MTSIAPDPNTVVYFENRFVPLSDARISILSHALNYGTGVFEGIRGFWDDAANNLFLLRPVEHYQRWKRNAGILRIGIGPGADELSAITAELCRRNAFRESVYVRPLAYKSAARIGVAPDDADAFSIAVVPFGPYFADRGLNVGVVSWRRIEDNAIPGRAKICGAYVNSVLATDEARRNGYDEAVFLTESGHVAEGATCNLFMVRQGKLITPAPTDNILEGITRACIIELAQHELHLEVVERSIDRSELYVCDEVFFTGTAVEVAPIVSVDRRAVGAGEIGPVARRLGELYFAATRGKLPAYFHWLRPVYEAAADEQRFGHAAELEDRLAGVVVESH